MLDERCLDRCVGRRRTYIENKTNDWLPCLAHFAVCLFLSSPPPVLLISSHLKLLLQFTKEVFVIKIDFFSPNFFRSACLHSIMAFMISTHCSLLYKFQAKLFNINFNPIQFWPAHRSYDDSVNALCKYLKWNLNIELDSQRSTLSCSSHVAQIFIINAVFCHNSDMRELQANQQNVFTRRFDFCLTVDTRHCHCHHPSQPATSNAASTTISPKAVSLQPWHYFFFSYSLPLLRYIPLSFSFSLFVHNFFVVVVVSFRSLCFSSNIQIFSRKWIHAAWNSIFQGQYYDGIVWIGKVVREHFFCLFFICFVCVSLNLIQHRTNEIFGLIARRKDSRNVESFGRNVKCNGNKIEIFALG